MCSKGAKSEINMTHKRALRALYGDYESTFEELLDKDKSKTIHRKNLQKLMVEIYKTINHLNPAYMWEFFIEKMSPTLFVVMNYVRCPFRELSAVWNKLPIIFEEVFCGMH